MIMKLFFLTAIIYSSIGPNFAFAEDGKQICSRTADINFQEIVVDTVATKRGEGLRFYLEKDQEAKKLLDEYQLKSAPKWRQAALGTVGTGVLLGGLFYSDNNSNSFLKKSNLLIIGTSLIVINALMYGTSQRENETILKSAVDTYNQRNLPQIIFSPFQNQGEEARNSKDTPGFYGGISKDF